MNDERGKGRGADSRRGAKAGAPARGASGKQDVHGRAGGRRHQGSGPRGEGRPAAAVAPRNDRIGEVRRSDLVGTFGSGAIVDLRLKSGDPVSGVVAGLEEWDAAAPAGQKGTSHPQSIYEPRLQALLGKRGFRLPPVRRENQTDNFDVLPVVRFPAWLQCPRCHRIARADEALWGQEIGKPDRWCLPCEPQANKRIGAVPVRFIVACSQGHLDDFPWQAWISCQCGPLERELELKNEGAGLAGKIVGCLRCKQSASLDGAFGRKALTNRGLKCRGQRPWIAGDAGGACLAPDGPRVLQRGASNVYWGMTQSALDIPPFSDDMSQEFGRHWSTFERSSPAKWPEIIQLLGLEEELGQPRSVLMAKLQAWADELAPPVDQPFIFKEFLKLVAGCSPPGVLEGQFEAVPETVPSEFENLLAGVSSARRLREVRALVGFTRIQPPSGDFRNRQQRLMPLAADQQALSWLPAVELRGEGIFIHFNGERLHQWEEQPSVQARVATHRKRVQDNLDGREMPTVSARFLLLHSFAHAMIRQLSLECGYSNSALRERLYVGDRGAYEMMGVLIHTGSPDSEGTLGGLMRQARVDLLGPTLVAALKSQAWCSSDPLCISGAATLSSPWNGSACHACQLIPETSCTEFNVLLDRMLLVGTDDAPALGYFGTVLRAL